MRAVSLLLKGLAVGLEGNKHEVNLMPAVAALPTNLCVQKMRAAGQGYVHRTGETGSVVFDRVRHADVLEYLWFFNRCVGLLQHPPS